MEFERQLIPLANLRLNKENDRHGPVLSEHECIEWLLEHHRDHMINLASDIAQNGLSPIEGILVLPAGDEAPGDFEVWEGNRRIAALKLLHDPNRCHDATIRRKFSTVRSKAETPIADTVECTIAPNVEEAERLIELRHQGRQQGVGTLDWNASQKARHQQRRGKPGRYSYSSRVLDAVKDKVDPELREQVEQPRFGISTLDRILKNKYTREFLGLSTEAGEPTRLIGEKETLKGLTKILQDVADGKKVSEVYNSTAIREYLDGFKPSETPSKKRFLANPKALAEADDTTPAKKKKKSTTRKLDRDRKRLIPPGITYSISHPRLREIHQELKALDVGTRRNAVAVLFRVFLELSIECFLDEHGVTFKPEERLKQKARKAVNYMDKNGWIKKNGRKGIDTAMDSKNTTHAVDTFHAYVHNGSFHVIPSDLNTAFDNLRPFFDALFENMG